MELKYLGQTAASALIHMDIRLEREHWTMFRNKTLGIAAAATFGLAAMLGSTAAYAIKICDSAPVTRDALTTVATNGCTDSKTYAAEALLMGETNATAAKDETDETVYYNITDTLVLAAPAEVGASGVADGYLVSIELEGMVFRSAAVLTTSGTGGGGGTYSLISGGASGDDDALFRLTGSSVNAGVDNLTLAADYAVSAAGGSAELTMTNNALQNLNLEGTAMHSGNPIMVGPALNEAAMAMNATADVAADGFMKFLDNSETAWSEETTVSVGTLMVGVKTGDDAVLLPDGTDADGVDDIIVTANDSDGDPQSTVTFSGDFSFASKVFLHGDNDCGAAAADTTNTVDTDEASAEADIRMVEDDVVGGTTMAQNVTAFATVQYLCIMVDPMADDAMRIPETGAYTAMGSYTGIENAAIGPMPMEQTLGMIERNGTTVVIPYLTTNPDYNQWIVMVNSGTAAARYEMAFTPVSGDETMATAGMNAMGMLEANTSTVLSVRNDDVVTLEGRQRVSAEIVIEAEPRHISIATHQRNQATGSTDTVTYSAQ